MELKEMTATVKQAKDEIISLREINADLLEALIEIETAFVNGSTANEMVRIATEAIRKAEEQTR